MNANAQTTEAAKAPVSAASPVRARRRRRRRTAWRPWLRALHRDFGYAVVGLTFVYALSGLAVNHIADWDPSFRQIERTTTLAGPLATDQKAAAKQVMAELGVRETPKEIYTVDESNFDIVLEELTLHVNRDKKSVFEEGQEPRFFLRLANWLHLNRGKKAWTAFADGYAVLLLFLASSGLFMIPGRKGLLGRGGVLVTLGALVPVLYIVLSGGP